MLVWFMLLEPPFHFPDDAMDISAVAIIGLGWFNKAPPPSKPEPSTLWATVLVVVFCWLLPFALLWKTNRAASASAPRLSTSLQSFAASPLFPVLIGSLSGLNLFTLVLTAPLILAFCTAAISARGTKGWVFVVLCNAAGETAHRVLRSPLTCLTPASAISRNRHGRWLAGAGAPNGGGRRH